jgi:hypothetical protein
MSAVWLHDERDEMKTFRQAVLEASKDVDLNLRQRFKLRVVLRLRPELLESELLKAAVAEGIMPLNSTVDSDAATANIDWDALLKFIKELLPVILEIISLFT